MAFLECCRALIRVINVHEKEILKLCDENQFSLSFIKSQLDSFVKSTGISVEATDNEVSENEYSLPGQDETVEDTREKPSTHNNGKLSKASKRKMEHGY
jgi:hypothetical protein